MSSSAAAAAKKKRPRAAAAAAPKRPRRAALPAKKTEEATVAAAPLPQQPSAAEQLREKRDLFRAKWLHTLEVLSAASSSSGRSSSREEEDAGEELARLARHLERGAFNHAVVAARKKRLLIHPGCPAFWRMYVARTCTVWRNLRRCPALFHRVRVGAVTGPDLEAMTAVELDLDHWRAELDSKSKRDVSRFQTRLVANTSEYTCKRCASKQCSTFEIQMRGGDEPATLFITCIDCSFRWKEE